MIDFDVRLLNGRLMECDGSSPITPNRLKLKE
jgi:hypothetical protein